LLCPGFSTPTASQGRLIKKLLQPLKDLDFAFAIGFSLPSS
jgi:hypothetical protein